MNDFININFWFDPEGNYFSTALFWLFLIIFALSAIGGIICLYWREKKVAHNGLLKKILTICTHWLNSFGFVGLFLFALKHYRVPYLGMRFWLAVWIIICLVWLAKIIKFFIVDVPEKKQRFEAQQQIDKYKN